MRKGQVEIIVILAVVIVAVVAILLATQTPSDVEPVSQEGRSVRNSLTNLITTAAGESLRTLSLYGGYDSPQPNSVQFLDDSVTYWQEDGDVTVPQAKQSFVRLTEKFINENKDSYVSGIGADIVVGEATVTATFLDSKIDLSVVLPSSMNDQPLPSTYAISIPTKFGDILEFSEDFSLAETRDRYLEYNTIASLLMSPIENGQHTTPLFISLTNCGDFVFKSWSDIKSAAEERVKVTLGHTYMPGKVPLNIGETTSFPKYTIPQFNGKRFEDIEVSFHLPDDFELTQPSFQFSPNPIIALASPVPMTSVCVSDPILINYFFNFPTIVRVKDPLTGNVFQFANKVFIKDNAPGDWSELTGYEQELQTRICSDPQCPLNLQVNSLNGAPVEGADVSFMGCQVGITSPSGSLQTAIPCGIGPLQIYSSGYEAYSETFSSESLNPATVTVPQMLNTKVFFYEVNIKDFDEQYWITGTDAIRPIPPDKKAVLTLAQSINLDSYSLLFDAVGTLNQVPAGEYAVLGALSSEDLQVKTYKENSVASH